MPVRTRPVPLVPGRVSRSCGNDPFFQRKVMYDNVPVEVLEEFRRLSNAQAQTLLERLDKWLSQHDRDTHPGTNGTGRMRTGIGIYYFEENMTSQKPKDSQS